MNKSNYDKIIISGTGCAIADLIYNRVSFTNPGFQQHLSKKPGDGGLSPGKLVFTEELEKFSGKPYPEILKEIVGNRPPDKMNVGGPSLVSLIHAAQMLEGENVEVKFFGMGGNDEYTEQVFRMIQQTPLNIKNYIRSEYKPTPTTDVFSDPDYDNGQGERTFVNNIGAAWDFTPELINDEFFKSHIQCYGGTALVPHLHDNLTDLLKRSKQNNGITVVNTVFDFRNQKNNPGKPWPLLDSTEDYRLIDVLIMDCEEAMKISGTSSIEEAALYFSSTPVSSFIITNGANDVLVWSGGRLFEKTEILKFPVSKIIAHEIQTNPSLRGDTTGCGDNFAGGIISSLAVQLQNTSKGTFNLTEAISWGVSSGGFCCFTVGGTYLELFPGEKKQRIQSIQEDYKKQLTTIT
ncbi:MAG: carbohydrate kinase family protein [Bacteroidetes bacterium]|nr:MAG: carbohydrate kinase family protein [Bacteroidota bacterium]